MKSLRKEGDRAIIDAECALFPPFCSASKVSTFSPYIENRNKCLAWRKPMLYKCRKKASNSLDPYFTEFFDSITCYCPTSFEFHFEVQCEPHESMNEVGGIFVVEGVVELNMNGLNHLWLKLKNTTEEQMLRFCI